MTTPESNKIRIKIIEKQEESDQLILDIFNLFQDERNRALASPNATLLRKVIKILTKLTKNTHEDIFYEYFLIKKIIEYIYQSVLIIDIEGIDENNDQFYLIIKKDSEDKVIERLQLFIVSGVIEIINTIAED